MKKKSYYVIFLIVLCTLLMNLNFGIATSREISNTESSTQDNCEYYVQKYLVILEIDGLDIHTTINITYNVYAGYKTEGFKRFLIPSDSNGEIDKKTIEVNDDEGNELEWDFKEIEGKNDEKFKEISFEHTKFTGIKTITMKFLMKRWIVEYFSYSKIELGNIGTFKIDVKKAVYFIIFPKDYKPKKIENSESGSGSSMIGKDNGKYFYRFIQRNSISNDIIIKCKPNLTDSTRWGSLYIIIPLIIILSCISIPLIAYGIWWIRLSEEEKEKRREKKRARAENRTRNASNGGGGCGGCGGGCGGCGGGCGGCGGGCGGCGGGCGGCGG